MESEEIHLSDSFEAFLSHLYGKQNYHQDVGLKSKNEWKKRIIKIVSSIETSINVTLEISDNKHKKKLLNICQGIKDQTSKASTINDLNEVTILGLFKLVFFLIGDYPDHWDYKKVNNPKHWKLNKHRQIMYYQDNSQKVSLILDSAPTLNEYNDGKYNYVTLMKKLYNDLKGNNEKFLEWVKDEYPEEYEKFF